MWLYASREVVAKEQVSNNMLVINLWVVKIWHVVWNLLFDYPFSTLANSSFMNIVFTPLEATSLFSYSAHIVDFVWNEEFCTCCRHLWDPHSRLNLTFKPLGIMCRFTVQVVHTNREGYGLPQGLLNLLFNFELGVGWTVNNYFWQGCGAPKLTTGSN